MDWWEWFPACVAVAWMTYVILQFWFVRKCVISNFCPPVVRNRKLIIFFIFNCCLPGADIGTDFYTFIVLVYLHPWWAGLTLAWMFVPFLIKLGIFVFDSLGKNGASWDQFKDVIIHFPFLLPLHNTFLLFVLDGIGYGSSNFNSKYSAQVESIQKDVGLASLYESLFEGIPQECFIVKIVFECPKEL